MKKALILWAAVLLLITPVTSTADEKPRSGLQPGNMAFNEKMIRLNRAFRDITTAVVIGDGERVEKVLDSLNSAGVMEKSRDAIRKGQITLKKNPEKIQEFIQFDQELQQNLEALLQAAKIDNEQKMAAITKKIIDNCVNCHTLFKK